MRWLTIAAASDPGRVKKNNQDRYGVYPPDRGKHHRLGTLTAVADGMGGHRGGAMAAQTAVDVLFETYYKNASLTILEALSGAFDAANSAVRRQAASDPALAGMGSTLTAMAIKGRRLTIGHVGDSRGYHISRGRIRQLTDDHSLTAGLVNAGVISAQAAKDHPDRHRLTRAIGIHTSLSAKISASPQTVSWGDYLLLCCDGLWEIVDERRMLETIQTLKAPEAICSGLVEQANRNGGWDNITVVVIRVEVPCLLSRFF